MHDFEYIFPKFFRG